MFDLVAKHKRIAQLILFLIMVPFAFFGVDYYFTGGAQQDTVATVGGEKITQTDYADAVREQTEQMRRQLGRNFDPRMFDNPEVRFAILDSLINQKLIANKAREENFRVSDPQLQQFIMTVPTFQEDGKFCADRYRMWLASQNMNPPYFEQRLRQDLMTGAVQEPIASSNIVARSSAANSWACSSSSAKSRSPPSTSIRSSRTSRSTRPRSRTSTTRMRRRSRCRSRRASSTCCSRRTRSTRRQR